MLALLYLETKSAHSTEGLSQALQCIHKSFPIDRMSGVYLLKEKQKLCMLVGVVCEQSLSQSKEIFPRLTQNIQSTKVSTDVLLLAYGDQISTAPYLAVPHPLLIESSHILALATEVAPDFIHPILNESLYKIIEGVDVENWGVFYCRGKSLLPENDGKTNVFES